MPRLKQPFGGFVFARTQIEVPAGNPQYFRRCTGGDLNVDIEFKLASVNVHAKGDRLY